MKFEKNTKKLEAFRLKVKNLKSKEDTKIERALQKYCNLKKPVITLTTDFPSSGRTAYVGCEQSAAGATAAKLISNSLTKKKGQILMGFIITIFIWE